MAGAGDPQGVAQGRTGLSRGATRECEGRRARREWLTLCAHSCWRAPAMWSRARGQPDDRLTADLMTRFYGHFIGTEGVDRFVTAWRGTVQWIARSPFRPEHKRKNWFVGIQVLEPPAAAPFDPRDVRFETMRASGPGGQHFNRTESAVRVTHAPTGLQASASEERSQHRNKALAVARLARKLEDLKEQQLGESERSRWRAHQALERGNPVKVFRED